MTEPTKSQQTLIALRNANKHLTEVFSLIDTKDQAMNFVSDSLRRAAAKCGEIKIDVWEGGNTKSISLKSHLTELATKLEGARS